MRPLTPACTTGKYFIWKTTVLMWKKKSLTYSSVLARVNFLDSKVLSAQKWKDQKTLHVISCLMLTKKSKNSKRSPRNGTRRPVCVIKSTLKYNLLPLLPLYWKLFSWGRFKLNSTMVRARYTAKTTSNRLFSPIYLLARIIHNLYFSSLTSRNSSNNDYNYKHYNKAEIWRNQSFLFTLFCLIGRRDASPPPKKKNESKDKKKKMPCWFYIRYRNEFQEWPLAKHYQTS